MKRRFVPIPRRLWRGYKLAFRRDWALRAGQSLSAQRGMISTGEREVVTFGHRVPLGVGFALVREEQPVGRRVEAFYLARAHHNAKAPRAGLSAIMSSSRLPVFALCAPLTGVSDRTQNLVVPEFGFRRIDRRRLWVDPRRIAGRRGFFSVSRLRTLRREDETGVVRLGDRPCRHHIDAAIGPGADPRRYGPEYIHSLFEAKDGEMDFEASFVVDGPRGLIGEVLVMNREAPHIHDLAVDPAHRGEGWGTALVVRSLGVLAARGITRTEIGVTIENPMNAYEMYRHLGFKPVPGKAGRNPGLWVNEESRLRLGLRILDASDPWGSFDL